MRDRNLNKKQQVAEWAAKGSEWCATRLYEARINQQEIRKNCEYYRRQSHVDYDLSHQVDNAAEVLKQNGIKPYRLIVEYIAKKCEDCGVDECCYWSPDECPGEDQKHVRTLSFWCFDISEDGIGGILTNFKQFDNRVISVKDGTGNVLWQEEIK